MPPIVPVISCDNPDVVGMGVFTGIDAVVVIGPVGMTAVVTGADDVVVIEEGGLGLGGGLPNGLLPPILPLVLRLIDFGVGSFGLTGFITGANSASSPEEGLRCKCVSFL